MVIKLSSLLQSRCSIAEHRFRIKTQLGLHFGVSSLNGASLGQISDPHKPAEAALPGFLYENLAIPDSTIGATQQTVFKSRSIFSCKRSRESVAVCLTIRV